MSDGPIISPLDNGPYIIKGAAKVIDPDGNEFAAREVIALCRCGRSEGKPFCDGTHKKVEFKDQTRA